MSNAANAQGGQVLNLSVPNSSGISELEFSIFRSGAGVTSVVTNRPDLVSDVTNAVAGTYVVAIASPLPDVFILASAALTRKAASTARGVQMSEASTSTSVTFYVTDAAGALVNLTNGDAFHVLVRFRRDGGSF